VLHCSAEAATKRVFIADDHDGYRSGIARLVAEHPALEVVGQAADGPRRSPASSRASRTSPCWTFACPR